MYNDLFTIGSLTVHTYGLMIAIGILVAEYVATRQVKRYGLKEDKLDGMILYAILYGFLGSKLTYVLLNWSAFMKNPSAYISNGWVVYGGIIGGCIGAYRYCKKYHLDGNEYVNLLFPEVALAQGFGRIGCFFAGCCYGLPTDSSIGVVFPQGSLAPAGVPLIPTQMISSIGDFILFFILFYNFNKGKHRYNTGALYFVLYSFGRFFVEMWRGDLERGFIGSFSTSQFLAIIVFVAGIVWMVHNQKRQEVNEEGEK